MSINGINIRSLRGKWEWDFRVKPNRYKRLAVDPENPHVYARDEGEAYGFAVIARHRVLAGKTDIEPVKAIKTEAVPVNPTTIQSKTVRKFVEESYIPWYRSTVNSRLVMGEFTLLLEMFGDRPLNEITQFATPDFRKAIAEVLDRDNLKGSWGNKLIMRAHAVFTQAQKAGEYTRENPFKLKRFPSTPAPKMVLKWEEQDALIDAILSHPKREHLLHWVGCVVNTGARIQDFRRLTKDMVFFSYDRWLEQKFRGEVHPPAVVYTSYKTGGQGCSEPRLRAVPINSTALPHFEALMKTEGDLLWPYGNPRTAWDSARKIAARKFPRLINAELACLRKTSRTRFDKTPLVARPMTLAKMFGHSPEIAFNHYLEIDWAETCKSAELLQGDDLNAVSFWSHEAETERRAA